MYSCSVPETKESSSLKRNGGNLKLTAKVKAPISLTPPEIIKLTLQNYLENKELESKIEQMQKEIQNQSLPINNNLEKDSISIMANANYKKIPCFLIAL